jgi:heterotetrameric sarcosine oxidase gamma subunit
VRLATCPADVVELAAYRGRSVELEGLAAGHGVTLSASGRCSALKDLLVLSVRPARWWLMTPPALPGGAAARWAGSLTRHAAVVDLSGALAAFVLDGPAVPEMLARVCRLDLRAHAFPIGSAAATIMVQVPVTLAALDVGVLLLTPATTARHLHEWLLETSRPFGPGAAFETSVRQLGGDDST